MKSQRKLKLLHVGKFYPPHMGGIETHLQALCRELCKSADLRVLVSSDSRETIDENCDGVPVSRVGTLCTLASAPFSPGMIGSIRRSGADIVHLHLPNPMAVFAYLASNHRGPLVITYHSDTVKQKFLRAIFEPFLQMVLRRASVILVTSPNYLATSPVLAKHRDRCRIVPYGIEVGSFANRNLDAILRLRCEHGDRTVISVGRLVYYKGFEHLVRAMVNVNGRLLIAGDGPLRSSLEELTRSLGLSERVIFLGEIQNHEIAPYYHAADVFALASVARSEAFGIVQIEAMASGVPVVNTGLDSGVPFVSLDGITGLTVPPADEASLSQALNKLLDDADLRKQFAQAARRRAESEFSLEKMTTRVLEVYEQVLDERVAPYQELEPAGAL